MKDFDAPAELIELMSRDPSRFQRLGIIPLGKDDRLRTTAICVDPMDFTSQQDFEILTGLSLGEKEQCTQEEFDAWFEEHIPFPSESTADVQSAMGEEEPEPASLENLQAMFPEKDLPPLPESELPPDGSPLESHAESQEDASPIVSVINRIIEDGYVRGAQSIYLIPEAESLTAYFEINREVKRTIVLPHDTLMPVIRRLIVMGQLNPLGQGMQEGYIHYKNFTTTTGIDILPYLTAITEGDTGRVRLIMNDPAAQK